MQTCIGPLNGCVFVYSSTVDSLWSTDSTDEPSVTAATRCLASCSDACIRIISPVSGDVITTCLTPGRRRLLSAAYAVTEGSSTQHYLLTYLDSGFLIVLRTSCDEIPPSSAFL